MLHNNRISIFIKTSILYHIIRFTFVLYYNLNPSLQSFHENIESASQGIIENSFETRDIVYPNECCSELYSTGWEIFEDLWNLDTEVNEYNDTNVRSEIKDTEYFSSQDLQIFPIPTECPKDIFYSDSSSSTTTRERKILDIPLDRSTYIDSNSTDNIYSEINLFTSNVLDNKIKKRKIEEYEGNENNTSKVSKQNISMDISDTLDGFQKEGSNLKKIRMDFNPNTSEEPSSSGIEIHKKDACVKKYNDQGSNDCSVSNYDKELTVQINILTANGEYSQIYEEIEYIPTIHSDIGNFTLNSETDIFKSYIIKYTVKGKEDEQTQDFNTLSKEEVVNGPMITILDIIFKNNFIKIVYIIRNIPKYLTPVFNSKVRITEQDKLSASKLHDFVYNISISILFESVHDLKIIDIIPTLKYNTEKKFWKDNYNKRIYKWESNLLSSPKALKFSNSDLSVLEHNKTFNNTKRKIFSKSIRTLLGKKNYKATFSNYHNSTHNSKIKEILSMLLLFKKHIEFTESVVNSPNNLKDTMKKICEFRMEFLVGKKKSNSMNR